MTYSRDMRVIDVGGLLELLREERECLVERAQLMAQPDPGVKLPADRVTMEIAMLMREAARIEALIIEVGGFTKHAPSPPANVRFDIEHGWVPS